MPTRPVPTPALLRGSAVGTSTATLTAAAHAAGGGGLPSGVGAFHLALLGLAIGVVSAKARGGDRFLVLVGALVAGQSIGHVLLGAGGHHHGPSSSGALMLAVHAAAVLVIAALIALGEVLCRAVSRAVRAATPLPSAPIAALVTPIVRRCEHPMRSLLLLAASSSYRGPPVSAKR